LFDPCPALSRDSGRGQAITKVIGPTTQDTVAWR
jgi:hypothetical protein